MICLITLTMITAGLMGDMSNSVLVNPAEVMMIGPVLNGAGLGSSVEFTRTKSNSYTFSEIKVKETPEQIRALIQTECGKEK